MVHDAEYGGDLTQPVNRYTNDTTLPLSTLDSLVSFTLCCMARFGAQCHDGTVYEIDPIMCEEALGL